MDYRDEMGNSNIIIYTTEDGLSKIETTFDGDTVWLSIDQMAELFQRDKSTISRHIKNIYSEEELVQEATVAYFATVQNEGNRQVERSICYYNLDVILSVGYRVFRICPCINNFRHSLPMNSIMNFVMNLLKKLNGYFRFRIIVNAGSINLQYLPVKYLFGGTNVPNPFKQFLKISTAA